MSVLSHKQISNANLLKTKLKLSIIFHFILLYRIHCFNASYWHLMKLLSKRVYYKSQTAAFSRLNLRYSGRFWRIWNWKSRSGHRQSRRFQATSANSKRPPVQTLIFVARRGEKRGKQKCSLQMRNGLPFVGHLLLDRCSVKQKKFALANTVLASKCICAYEVCSVLRKQMKLFIA